jgi:hypothetical protein
MGNLRQQQESEMIDEDRRIFKRIIDAIMPDEGHDGYMDILIALNDAISFQLAFACPICRKRLASKLRQNIPAILVRANQYNTGKDIKCNLH